MRQGIQANFSESDVKEYGCFFLSILRLAEEFSKKDFSEDEVLDFYKQAKGKKYISDQCHIEKSVELLNLAAGKVIVSNMLKMDSTDQPQTNLYIICQKKPMYAHFIAYVNGALWDPLDPNRPSAKNYKTASYRVFY